VDVGMEKSCWICRRTKKEIFEVCKNVKTEGPCDVIIFEDENTDPFEMIDIGGYEVPICPICSWVIGEIFYRLLKAELDIREIDEILTVNDVKRILEKLGHDFR